jgi:hypothetical protein
MNLEWSKILIGFTSILFFGELFTLVQEILWKRPILSPGDKNKEIASIAALLFQRTTWFEMVYFILFYFMDVILQKLTRLIMIFQSYHV